jgi:hypothetical protein
MNAAVIGELSRRIFGVLVRLALLQFLLSSVLVSDAWNQEDKYSLAAIRVYLYYHSTGEIDSRDLLDGKVYNLWNTIIGAGVAQKPSRAVLLLVDLVGPTFAKIDGELVIKAIAGETTLLESTLSLRDWYEDEKLVLPFLIYGTGCEKLEISAKLQGFPCAMIRNGMLKKFVPFECGD